MLKYILILLSVGLGYFAYNVTYIPAVPEKDLDQWWGEGQREDVDTAVKPFKIEFNDTVITDLKYRLKHRRPFTRTLEGTQSMYGLNSEFLQQVVQYWHDKYDFKARESNLNIYPHFKTNLHGLEVHFVHVKPKIPTGSKVQVLPIMLLHGWPSSFKEFEYMIPLLTTPREGYDFVFEVISPDLPGHGFSEGTTKPGFNTLEIGIIMRNLMHRLGFKRYYIQAGDWGSQAAVHLATILPEEVLGLHINLPISDRPISVWKTLLGALYPPILVEEKYASRMYPLTNNFGMLLRETGYFHQQATKPDTIGFSLSDSPSGLAAWLLEKMAAGTNQDLCTNTTDGGLLTAFSMDDLLDLITINWVNDCGTTSMRLYAENMGPMRSSELFIMSRLPTPVPTAAIKFLHEIVYQTDWILKDKFPNLVHSTTLDYGGHFAALERPEELAADVWEATRSFVQFYKK